MNKKGFTLIEMLIIVTVIGIILTIAIPNFLAALQKGKQKATMGDMKTLGVAIESYMTDNGMAPGAGAFTLVTDVEPYIRGFHSRSVASKDGWGQPFRYESAPLGANQTYYSIISYGRDQVATGIDPANSNYIVDTMQGFENDICFSNGTFTYAPKIK